MGNTTKGIPVTRRLIGAAGLMLALAVPAQAAKFDGGAYWTTPEGEVWKNADGECWQSPNAPKEQPRPECGDEVETAQAPPPKPRDNDGDGVPDSRDQCPDTPSGTPVDSSGCPEQKEEPVVLEGVSFEFNSAQLTPGAEDRLDNVVNALQAADRIDVRIKGHTDSLGSAEYNMDLSQRRAGSVKTYLTGHGISGARLVTEGFGESRPMAPNTKPDGSDNPAGRAENRRVELHVIEE